MANLAITMYLQSSTGFKCPKCGRSMTVSDLMSVVHRYAHAYRDEAKPNRDNDACGSCFKAMNEGVAKSTTSPPSPPPLP